MSRKKNLERESPVTNGKQLNLLYMGTPAFAAVSLQYLIDQGYHITGVVCRADKPKGRGMQVLPPPVKVTAEAAGLPVYQPETLKDGALQPVLEATKPDLIVVVAYGKILPPDVLNAPRLGCINLHGSLLPKYRGAAPIQRAVMDGEKTTGLTTMYLSQGMDEGDMLLKTETEIGADETSGELTERLARLGAPLLAETIERLADGTAVRTPQNHAEATYAKMLEKAEGRLDFSQSADSLYRIYRALTPALSVTTAFRGKLVKVTEMCLSPVKACNGQNGEVIACSKQGIDVRCGDGSVLTLKALAPEGKRAMSAADFINGRAVQPGDCFGA